MIEVNILWSQHQVHHSSEEYNLSTALRQGVVQRWATWVRFAMADLSSLFCPVIASYRAGAINFDLDLDYLFADGFFRTTQSVCSPFPIQFAVPVLDPHGGSWSFGTARMGAQYSQSSPSTPR